MELVKGFKDYTGEEAIKRGEVKKIILDVFERYGFESSEAPVVEYEKFVIGENPYDEAVSDIFRLKDKGKRKLALRYEHTFQLKRFMKNKKVPYKRYVIGPVFRDEPVTKNRVRQFVQCDVDIVGSDIKDDAEIVSVVKEILSKLGIKFVIYFNNRKLLDEILDEFNVLRKEEVIREIDKMDKVPEVEVRKNLKKYGAEKILDVIKKPKKFFKKYDSFKEVEEFEKYCGYYGVDVKFSPFLARGLSYYKGIIFEVKTPSIKETIIGGGSYVFNDVQSTGISFGLDRLSDLANVKFERDSYLVVSLGYDKEAIKIAQKLKGKGKSVSMFYGKPTRALGYANYYKIKKVIFVGEKEVKSKKFKVKDMGTGKESLLK